MPAIIFCTRRVANNIKSVTNLFVCAWAGGVFSGMHVSFGSDVEVSNSFITTKFKIKLCFIPSCCVLGWFFYLITPRTRTIIFHSRWKSRFSFMNFCTVSSTNFFVIFKHVVFVAGGDCGGDDASFRSKSNFRIKICIWCFVFGVDWLLQPCFIILISARARRIVPFCLDKDFRLRSRSRRLRKLSSILRKHCAPIVLEVIFRTWYPLFLFHYLFCEWQIRFSIRFSKWNPFL